MIDGIRNRPLYFYQKDIIGNRRKGGQKKGDTVDGCEILHHQEDGWNPTNSGLKNLSTGSGFLPSAVWIKHDPPLLLLAIFSCWIPYTDSWNSPAEWLHQPLSHSVTLLLTEWLSGWSSHSTRVAEWLRWKFRQRVLKLKLKTLMQLHTITYFLRVIPTLTHYSDIFWHSFWHTIWKCILSDILSGIYSDILSGSGILSGIYSDILSGIYADILSGIVSGI